MTANSSDKIWVNSADDHVYEPADLWQQANLPEHILKLAPYKQIEDDREIYYCEGKQVFRTPLSMKEAMEPPGSLDIKLRMKDLDEQGIWTSVAFASTALWTTAMTNSEAQTACVRAYNDWCQSDINSNPRMLGAAMLPLLSLEDSLKEAQRVLKMGFKAIAAPTTLPPHLEYNQEQFEPLWALLEEARVPFCFHIGTGPQPLAGTRGPGGAVINYCETAIPAQRCITHMVASGALDRHPKLKVMVAEGGCSWIPALVDRMTEAYRQHAVFVKPKLTREIQEIVYTQVYTSFQHDRSALPIMQATGYDKVMWGCDYPHLEGTFPNTQRILHELFDGVPEAVRRQVTIGNFDTLFGVTTPKRIAA